GPSLSTVRAGPHLKVEVGRLEWKLAEEDFRHLKVVVLAGIEKEVLNAVFRRTRRIPALDAGAQHGRLHELWPHTDNGEQFCHAGYWFSRSCSAGTSRVTTEPAATRASSPSVRPGSTVTLAPIRDPRIMVTPL